jgi:Zn-dependent protease
MRQKWLQLRRVRILGARVYVHWSAFAVVLLLALVSVRSPVYAAIAIASYLGMIFLHEAGHAWVARRLGYEVEALYVAFLHGRCEYEVPDTQFEDALIAWGGALAQLAVAAPILVVATVCGDRDLGFGGPAVAVLGYVNLLVALVNLAPAEGLDGHKAWRAIPLFWRYRK